MKNREWRAVVVLQVLLIVTGALFPSDSVGVPPSVGPTDGPLVARVYVRNGDHLDAVAGELDIWEVHGEEGYAVTALTAERRRWLESLGYRVELEAREVSTWRAASALDPRFYYFDDQYPSPNNRHVVDLLQAVNAAYPDLTQLIDVGDAWLVSQPGEPDRDIWVLRITNEDPSYGEILDKPAFFLSAAMHAREVATAELAIRYVKYLTAGYDGAGGYGVDPDVTWLVDHHVAYVLVMHNPDGHVENERDPSCFRRKNVDWDDGCFLPYAWGVDLNRNHSFLWGCCGGSSGDPCRETYRGPSRASEPETQALERYFAKVMKDQNGPNGEDEIPPPASVNTTGIFISLHSYGDLILWPWGFDDYGSAPNHAELQTIGRKFAAFNGYVPVGMIGYETDGTADDWTYGMFGIPSFTFEVGPADEGDCSGFFPAYECIDGHAGRDFWGENRPAFLYAHRIARRPYLTAYGPDVQSLTFERVGASLDGVRQIGATIDDRRCCGDTPQPIVGAEYFVDVPGEDGAGTPMHPADGLWGEARESAVALVDCSALPAGRHYVLVHGQSEGGHWGPFRAIFLEVDRHLHLPLILRG